MTKAARRDPDRARLVLAGMTVVLVAAILLGATGTLGFLGGKILVIVAMAMVLGVFGFVVAIVPEAFAARTHRVKR